MAVDYEKLREHVREAYANPSAEMLDGMAKYGDNSDLASIQSRWADVLADIAVLTMKEIDRGTSPKSLIEMLSLLSVSSLANLFSRMPNKEHEMQARNYAASYLLSGVSSNTEFVEDSVDIKTKAN